MLSLGRAVAAFKLEREGYGVGRSCGLNVGDEEEGGVPSDPWASGCRELRLGGGATRRFLGGDVDCVIASISRLPGVLDSKGSGGGFHQPGQYKGESPGRARRAGVCG